MLKFYINLVNYSLFNYINAITRRGYIIPSAVCPFTSLAYLYFSDECICITCLLRLQYFICNPTFKLVIANKFVKRNMEQKISLIARVYK